MTSKAGTQRAAKKPTRTTGSSSEKFKLNPTFRSRVSTGANLLPSVDGRSTSARIMRDTYDALVSHAGGSENISEPMRLQCRRASALEADLAFMEDKRNAGRVAGDDPVAKDLDLYGRLCGQQRRCLETLGWHRSARDITPDPLTYAREYDQRKAAEAEDFEVVE
jgi:hypothetical protein